MQSIFYHFKGVSMKQITQTILEGESPTLLKTLKINIGHAKILNVRDFLFHWLLGHILEWRGVPQTSH